MRYDIKLKLKGGTLLVHWWRTLVWKNGLKQLGTFHLYVLSVGDRYVMEQLLAKGWKIGAENSGHVILLDKSNDGWCHRCCAAVLASVVDNWNDTEWTISRYDFIPSGSKKNVRFSGDSKPIRNEAVKGDDCGSVGSWTWRRSRVLLRKSGTEPLLRVMVEGEDADLVQKSRKIADAVKAIAS